MCSGIESCVDDYGEVREGTQDKIIFTFFANYVYGVSRPNGIENSICDQLYEKGPFGIKVQFPIIAKKV